MKKLVALLTIILGTSIAQAKLITVEDAASFVGTYLVQNDSLVKKNAYHLCSCKRLYRIGGSDAL